LELIGSMACAGEAFRWDLGFSLFQLINTKTWNLPSYPLLMVQEISFELVIFAFRLRQEAPAQISRGLFSFPKGSKLIKLSLQLDRRILRRDILSLLWNKIRKR
jgi:hypothetical protein